MTNRTTAVKRKRGRPPGSKDSRPRHRRTDAEVAAARRRAQHAGTGTRSRSVPPPARQQNEDPRAVEQPITSEVTLRDGPMDNEQSDPDNVVKNYLISIEKQIRKKNAAVRRTIERGERWFYPEDPVRSLVNKLQHRFDRIEPGDFYKPLLSRSLHPNNCRQQQSVMCHTRDCLLRSRIWHFRREPFSL